MRAVSPRLPVSAGIVWRVRESLLSVAVAIRFFVACDTCAVGVIRDRRANCRSVREHREYGYSAWHAIRAMLPFAK
jgi:hypothetical protein